MAKFKTIITTAGAAKIAAALAGTDTIILDGTAKMAIGDGNGTLPIPVPSQTKLVNEVHRAPLNNASIDASNPKNIVIELVIPPETGGFWMREMALYDSAGSLLAVGNMAETYKPSTSEGAGRKSVIRMVIAVSDVTAVTITMDSSTVMATQDYVDNQLDEHEKSRNHPDATLTEKGFTQLNSATDNTSETQAATPKAVKTVMDATSLKAPLASPALTGTPTAPTAPADNNSQQLANTAFVRAVITALINAAPGGLDTLGELAAALGNDANFAATMTAALAAKAPLASPALTGLPTAPTAAQTVNGTQIATTAFVKAAVAALVDSSPGALDTLNELAAALGDDPNFATTMTNALAGKQPLDTTLTNLSGKSVAGLITYLGLADVARLAGAAFKGDISAPNMRGDESVTVGDGSGGMGAGGVDGAGFGGNNLVIKSWNGIGFLNTNTKITQGYIDTINGYIAAAKRLYAGNAFMDESGNISGTAWAGGNLAGVVGKKTDGDNIKQVGLYQNDKTKPYMLHTDNSGVFMATLAHLSSADASIRVDLQTWTNQNFVQAVRFGAVEQGNVYRNPGFADSLGYVITGIENGDNNDTPDRIQRRLLQGKVNGTWYTLGA